MRRSIPVLFLALALMVPAPASARTDLRSCPTKSSFMAGPFFVSKVRARAVSCTFARRLVKRWGRTRDCVFPAGPSDVVCRVGRYRCVFRDTGYEGGRETCKRRGTRKAVGFNFSS
jgi:hypothetical protein